MTECPQCGKPIPEGQDKCPACSDNTANLSPETTAKILLLKKKIELEPGNVRLYLDLGDLYSKQSMLSEAIKEYESAIEVNPQNYDARMKAAHLYFKMKDYAKAENTFRAALHINPKLPDSLIGLFRTYYLQDRTDEAIVIGEKIVQLKPDNVEFHLLLKNMYIRKGDHEKALNQLLKLEVLTPQNDHILKELAARYKEGNIAEKMVEYFEKLKKLNIIDVDLGLKIGDHFQDTGDNARSAECLKGLLDAENITPEQHVKILISLANAHAAAGKTADARKILDDLGPLSEQELDEETRKKLATVHYQIGQAALQNNKPKEAISAIEQAARIDNKKDEYAQTLSTMKTETTVADRRIMKKALVIAAIALAACAVILAQWFLVRNRIVIRVTPPDSAAVYVDGKLLPASPDDRGAVSTPIMFMGRHKVTVEKDGFEKWEGSAAIGYGRAARLNVDLKPISYVLQVSSVPESADVIIDGRLAGRTPFISDSVLACPHAIEIARDGFAPWRGKLTVTKRDSVNLGVVSLKNLSGQWLGKLDTETYAANAGFSMTVDQTGNQLLIKYNHQSIDDRTYKGDIKGRISKGEFFAAGEVTVYHYELLRRTRGKVIVTMRGRIADNWDRIDGTHNIEGRGDHAFSVKRR